MKTISTIQEKLENHPFLKGMRPEYLAIIASHAQEAEFTPDLVIFREGDIAYQFYLILEGKVAVESYVPGGDNIPLQILTGGDVLGWSWLFPPFAWHFHARALEPTRAIFIDGANLLVASEHFHGFGFELMQRIAQVVIERLEAAQTRLFELEKTSGTPPAVAEQPSDELPRLIAARSAGDILAEHPWLSGMKWGHREILADAAMKAGFKKDEVILRKGEPADRFYLIQHGKVVVEAVAAEDTSIPIQIINDGGVLGASSLFPPFHSRFDARALEPTETIFLPARRLRDECERNHDLGHALTKRTVAVIIQALQATRRRLLSLERTKMSGFR